MKKLLITALLMLFSTISFASEITLDHLEGNWYENNIYPNQEFTMYFRYTNTDDSPIRSLRSGFQIWTQNNSSFMPPVIDTLPYNFDGFYGWDNIFDLNIGFYNINNDGSDIDTIGWSAIKEFSGVEMYDYFDETIIKITTGNIPEGESICIDSCFFPASGYWRWDLKDSRVIYPDWGGPYCFDAVLPSCDFPFITNKISSLQNFICEEMTQDFDAEFQNCSGTDNLLYSLISGPGTIDPSTGVWSYTPDIADVGIPQQVFVRAYSEMESKGDSCIFSVTARNHPPTVPLSNYNYELIVGQTTQVQLSPNDLDACNNIFYYSIASGQYAKVDENGLLQYHPTTPLTEAVKIDVNDGAATTRVQINFTSYLMGDFNLDNTTDVFDLVLMVQYMLKDGNPPQKEELLNVDGIGTIDIEDLIYYIDYQFHDGPEPIVPL